MKVLRKIKREKLIIGEPYVDELGAEFIYVGKFKHKKEERDCLFFYPMNKLANCYFKEKDGTVAFIDLNSFYIHEEV